MTDITITVEGEFPDLGKVKRIVLEEADKAMHRSVILVESNWKKRAERSRRTGRYQASITHTAHRIGNLIYGRVGTSLFYAKFLEFGTGLYGPLHHWIEPHPPNKALRFPASGKQTFNPATGAYTGFQPAAGFRLTGTQRSGRAGAMAKFVFARRVRGIQPRFFAQDAFLISTPFVYRIFDEAMANAGRRIMAGGAL